jgi:hypothetical protein
MTSAERDTYGMVSDPIGYGINAALDSVGARAEAKNTLGSPLGDIVAGAPAMAARKTISAAVTGYGPATADMKMPGILESFMQMLGIQPAQRNIVGPTAAEMQGLADRYGYDQPTPYGQSPGSTVGGVDMGGTIGGGLAGVGQAPGDTRDQTGESGGATGGNSDTGGTSDSTGGSRGGEGSDRAWGGVDVFRRPGTLRFGERASATPETVVSVPQSMKRPGQQGNEPQVEQVMRQLLRALRR